MVCTCRELNGHKRLSAYDCQPSSHLSRLLSRPVAEQIAYRLCRDLAPWATFMNSRGLWKSSEQRTKWPSAKS